MYKVHDITDSSRKLAMKVCKESANFDFEIKAMQAIHRKTSRDFKNVQKHFTTPEVISHGKLVCLDNNVIRDGRVSHIELRESQTFSFVIMPRYSLNLDQYFDSENSKFSKATTFYIGFSVLQLLEQVHRAGYIFNDLKPDNLITIMDNSVDIKKSSNVYAQLKINLIDFGFATQFMEFDKDNRVKHCEPEELENFRGNIIFASPNQLDFMSTSRRDDLISLCYMIIYFLTGGNIPGVESLAKDYKDLYKEIAVTRKTQTVEDICNEKLGTQELY